MASTPRADEDEDEYELTLFGRVVVPLGGLLARLDGGPEPADLRGWFALVMRLVRRWWVLLLGTVVAVLVAAAIVVYFATRTTPDPSTTAAARLALGPSRGRPPAVANADYLALSYAGVTFPNYRSLNAVATGQTSGQIDGRPAMTVFYRLGGGQRLSYTVFSGRPTHAPPSARTEYLNGVGLRAYRTRGLNVVTGVRHGRTVVAASPAPASKVLALSFAPILRDTNQADYADSGCAACG